MAPGSRGGCRGINSLKVHLKVTFRWRIGSHFLASRKPAAGPMRHNASYFSFTNEFFLSAGSKQGEELSWAAGTSTALQRFGVCWYKVLQRSMVCRPGVPGDKG